MLGDAKFFAYFASMVLFALTGSACWYFVAWRLSRAGFRLRVFASLHDTIAMFREYSRIASARGWSRWPLGAFWICGAATLVAAFALSRAVSSESAANFMNSLRPAFLPCAALTSLCMALIFSRRILKRRLPVRATTDFWTQLRTDAFFRNDFYVTTLAWVGFVVATAATVAG